MADLLTTEALATWTQKDPGDVAADPFAEEVISSVSAYLCFLGGHDGTQVAEDGITPIPEWTYEPGPDQAPMDVRMLALKVIRRTYTNPDQVVQEGNVGPIGGDRVADDATALFNLTENERRVVTKYNDEGDPEEGGQLWIQPIGSDQQLSLEDPVLFVGDNLQVNLETTNAAPEWKIPLFSPGDPGDPNLYTD